MADRIVVLRAGKVEQVDTPLALFNRPANLFVAGFIGAPGMNLWQGAAGPSGFAMPGGLVLPVAAGGATTLGLRPQHLRLDPDGPLQATVTLVEALGAESVIHADLPGGEKLLAVLPGQPDLARGASVRLGFDAAQVHLFGPDGQRIAA